jgi:transcriptional regulator of arginine metabolism
MKDRRQRAILTLVATRPVHSQEQLAQLLDTQGFETTQATVSRDIKELGLIKVPLKNGESDGNLFKYVVPSATINYVSRLHRAVGELVVSIEQAMNLIVLKTSPGCAMLVASALDEAAWPEIIGTVGGDDTVLVIVRSIEQAPVVKQRFADLRASGQQ